MVDSFESVTMAFYTWGKLGPPKGTGQDSRGGWVLLGLAHLSSLDSRVPVSLKCCLPAVLAQGMSKRPKSPDGRAKQLLFGPAEAFGDGWQPEPPRERTMRLHVQFLSGMPWSLVRGKLWGQTDLSLLLPAS